MNEWRICLQFKIHVKQYGTNTHVMIRIIKTQGKTYNGNILHEKGDHNLTLKITNFNSLKTTN